MKEIEILVEVFDSIENVKKALRDFNYVGLKHTIDEYYYDPKRDTLKPDVNNNLFHCLRLREKNNTYTITYKDDVFDGDKWLLGLKRFITIDNKKETYTYKDYEIVIEDVKDLGLFMEVEFCTSDDVDVKKVKDEIQQFIDSLNIKVSPELNMGKPEMYMKKNNIIIE